MIELPPQEYPFSDNKTRHERVPSARVTIPMLIRNSIRSKQGLEPSFDWIFDFACVVTQAEELTNKQFPLRKQIIVYKDGIMYQPSVDLGNDPYAMEAYATMLPDVNIGAKTLTPIITTLFIETTDEMEKLMDAYDSTLGPLYQIVTLADTQTHAVDTQALLITPSDMSLFGFVNNEQLLNTRTFEPITVPEAQRLGHAFNAALQQLQYHA